MRRTDAELEAIGRDIIAAEMCRGESRDAGVPWVCSHEPCDRQRNREAASAFGRLAKNKRRGTSGYYANLAHRSHASRHRKACEAAGIPWDCACVSCRTVRDGWTRTKDNRLQKFKELK